MFVCFTLGLSAAGWGKPLVTVELMRAKTKKELMKSIATMENFPALWIAKESSSFSLRMGIFPDRQYAMPLDMSMKSSFPSARIVETAMPASFQWVSYFDQVSLKNLGYSRPILAQGVHAYASFHIPWSRRFTTLGSSLHLSLKVSPVLAEASTLTILAEGTPLKSVKLAGPQGLTLNIPLDTLKNIPVGETLDIEIRGYFTITGDLCTDEATGNLWILIDNESYLSIKRLHPPTTIRDFFRNFPLVINIVPGKNEKDYVESVCNLAILAGYVSRYNLAPITFQQYVPKACNIFIGSYEKDIRIYGNDLYITPRGVRLLTSRWLSSLVFKNVKYSRLVSMSYNHPRNITFGQLGYTGSLMRGIGELTASIPLPATHLGGWPSNLLCTLLFSHSPISDKERAFLKVRFNGILIESREIQGEGGIQSLTFSIPTRYFNARNNLDVAFSYYRNSGKCQGNFPEMEVSVMKDSFFTVKSYQKKPDMTMGSYPAICIGRGAIVLNDLDPDNWMPLLPILENLGRNQSVPYPITLVSWEEFTEESYDFGIMNLGVKLPVTLEPAVRHDQAFMIVNPVTKKPLLDIKTTDPVAVVQTFYTTRGIPLVLFTRRPGIRVAPSTMMEALFQQTPANVIIFGPETWTGLEIGKKLRVVYPDAKGFSYYWALYRPIIFIALGAIIMIFLFFVFHKLATR